MPMRVYPDPSADGRVGIPREGEVYETEDAERLIGMGIVTRSKPDKGKRKAGATERAVKAARAGKLSPSHVVDMALEAADREAE